MAGATQHVFETLFPSSPRDESPRFLQILVTNAGRVLTAFRDPALQRLQHKHEETVPLLERALAIRVSALGEDHKDTTLSQINLEMAQRQVGGDKTQRQIRQTWTHSLRNWGSWNILDHNLDACTIFRVAGIGKTG